MYNFLLHRSYSSFTPGNFFSSLWQSQGRTVKITLILKLLFSVHPKVLMNWIQGNKQKLVFQRAQNFVHHFTTKMFPVGRQMATFLNFVDEKYFQDDHHELTWLCLCIPTQLVLTVLPQDLSGVSCETASFANKVSNKRSPWGVVPSVISIGLTGLIFKFLPKMLQKIGLWISIANHTPLLQPWKSCSFNQCIFTTNFPCRQASLFLSSNWSSIGFKAISRSQSYRAQNFVHHITSMYPVGRQSTDNDLHEYCRFAIFSRWPL